MVRQRVARSLGNDGLFAERRRWIVWPRSTKIVWSERCERTPWTRQPGQPALQDDQVPADIGWLLFEPDRPAAGTLLLETALASIGDDPEGIEAFQLAHGLGWGGAIPTAWQHIDEAIARRGFAWHDTSYLMWGEGTPGFGGSVNQDVRVEFEIGDNNDWQFWAQLEGRRVRRVASSDNGSSYLLAAHVA